MSIAFAVLLGGVGIAMAGHYRSRIAALERNPVTRMRIVPRTMFEDSMGVDWVTETIG